MVMCSVLGGVGVCMVLCHFLALALALLWHYGMSHDTVDFRQLTVRFGTMILWKAVLGTF